MKRDEYWQQFEEAPPIDCLKMKYDIQARIYEETKDMSWAERREYFRAGSDRYHDVNGQGRTEDRQLIVCEDSEGYRPKEP